MAMPPFSFTIYFAPLPHEKMNIESLQVVAVSRFRSNAARDEDVETFYRLIVFILALDAINLDMNDRFSMQQKAALTLAFLLPKNVTSETTTQEFVKPAFDK